MLMTVKFSYLLTQNHDGGAEVLQVNRRSVT